MKLIGENIHIISKSVREALENRDENFVKNLIKIQNNVDCIDLNIGPARGKLDKIFDWLIPLAQDKNLSLDSTNVQTLVEGMKLVQNPAKTFINSTSKDSEKLEKLTDLAAEYGSNLIALALSKETGIPKTADGRLEIVFEIYEKCMEKGIESDKIYFDPLILPICADQSQALESLNTIQMIKESFEPKVNTVIGLSNISNGCSKNLRPMINQVYATLAFGAGLDAIILDAKDVELVRILNMLESQTPETSVDRLYFNLANMVQNFEDINEIKFDKTSIREQNIIKTAEILLNKKIYSDSFTQV